jgi:MraZ protein
MFRGFSFHTIDDKGRIVVPTRFRAAMRTGAEDRLMLSRLDRCLVGYPMEVWASIEGRILSLAEKSETMRRFRRVFIGGAFECSLDRQERILVPPALRQYAALSRDIVMVGVLDHFEIWSRESWIVENELMDQDILKEEVRNEIAKLGL